MKSISSRSEAKELLSMAIYMGEILLRNGAETYRVEDSVQRVCMSFPEITKVDVFCAPSIIISSVEYNNERFVNIERVKSISINLKIIHLTNNFSREFVQGNMSISDGFQILATIENYQFDEAKFYYNVKPALIGPFFCVMFGGNFYDFIACFLVTFFMLVILEKIRKMKMNFFFDNFIGALLASIFAYLSLKVNLATSIDSVIIGAIMPLVPGVAITNAVRDIMNGEFVSGVSKLMEAVFIAFSIAVGVGVVLMIYIKGLN